MKKIQFKGGTMLNPVPVVMVTSKNSKGDTNVFTVAWAGTATQLERQYKNMSEVIYE